MTLSKLSVRLQALESKAKPLAALNDDERALRVSSRLFHDRWRFAQRHNLEVEQVTLQDLARNGNRLAEIFSNAAARQSVAELV